MSLNNFLTRTFLLNTDELEDRATLVLANARDEEVTDITIALDLPEAVEIKPIAAASEAADTHVEAEPVVSEPLTPADEVEAPVADDIDVEEDLAGGDRPDAVEVDENGRAVFRIEHLEPKGRVKLGVLVAPGQEGETRSFAVKAECAGTVNGSVDRESLSVSVSI